MEEKSLMRQIEELKEDSDRYKHMKERYHGAVIKIDAAMQLLEEAKKVIAPEETIKNRARTEDIQKIFSDVMYSLNNGLAVSVDALEKKFPDANISTIKYIMYHKIASLKNIEKRNIDGRKEYYLRNA